MKLMTLAMTIALAASTAMANDHIIAINDHAKDLQGDYMRMAATLKNKNFSSQELQTELNAIRGQLEQLKTLADQFEASSTNLTEAQRAQWKSTKDVISLLDIFHSGKEEMLTGDKPHKKRKMLKQIAEQNAFRSSVLQERASRLLDVIN